jgi:nucleoside-diphosphate-sugar epimerase
MVAREKAAHALGAARGVAVCALRIGNVAGADAILGGWQPGFTLDRFADGTTPRRSYIGPGDLAQALEALIAHPSPLPAALNLTAPGLVAMGDLLKAAGLEYQTRPAPPDALPIVQLETARLARLISLPPPATPADLVAQWRAWHRIAP